MGGFTDVQIIQNVTIQKNYRREDMLKKIILNTIVIILFLFSYNYLNMQIGVGNCAPLNWLFIIVVVIAVFRLIRWIIRKKKQRLRKN